ncbi:hypothetical protein B5V89_19715, partial [Heyndrickxia sporothermodurans]|uniref:hypothetical protein n=1 Tax=Heyndrickxia sporothermodurans TaxID=46224 RepID=UPI000D4A54E9
AIINAADIHSYRLKSDVAKGIDKVRHGLVIGEGYNTPKTVIDGDGVEQYEMNSLSWKAIQELSQQNEKLILKIASLEERLAKLEVT